ncbi:M6 family metalloprotease-like protein (plasmid) [Ensifer sp. WSM1721]
MTRLRLTKFLAPVFLGLTTSVYCTSALGHSVLDPSEEAALMRSADASERVLRMNRLQTNEVGAGLRQQAFFTLFKGQLEAAGLSSSDQAAALTSGPLPAFPYPAKPELMSVGAPRTLTVLVDFKNIKASDALPGLTSDRISQNIYGSGTAKAASFFPYESVHEYYRRASEGKLNLQGNVRGWVHLTGDREHYEPKYPAGVTEQTKARIDNQSLFDLISEALDQLDEETDFSKYDNDNDGDIDFLTVMYAGPDNGWGGFWWAYRWEFFVNAASSKRFDGKRLKQFVFQFVSVRESDDFDPVTLIHETGHALGLPDYYDYCSSKRFNRGLCSPSVSSPGPDGGVGGLDVMDANRGNHNALSRWLLDWIVPKVVRPGSEERIVLEPSGSDQSGTKAVAIFPGLTPTVTPGQELFLLENRMRVGNDAGAADMPGEGLLIWHVDSRPNARNTDFVFDNSFTFPKLIRLVRRGKKDDFGDGEPATGLDYFNQGDAFTPETVPSTVGYDGKPTHIAIDEIGVIDQRISVRVGYRGTGEPVVAEGVAGDGPLSRRFGTLIASPPFPNFDLSALNSLERDTRLATPAELARMWNEYKTLIDPNAPITEATIAAELLIMSWAAKDGKAAVTALLEMGRTPFVERVFPQIMEAWVSNDPAGADTWYLAPEQAELRTGGSLISGENFARELFQWRSADNPSNAASAIDLLSSASEIYGAVAGLTNAAEVAGADAATVIKKQLQGLTKRAPEAAAIANLQEALDKVAAEIQDLNIPKDDSFAAPQFNYELENRLRRLGVQ